MAFIEGKIISRRNFIKGVVFSSLGVSAFLKTRIFLPNETLQRREEKIIIYNPGRIPQILEDLKPLYEISTIGTDPRPDNKEITVLSFSPEDIRRGRISKFIREKMKHDGFNPFGNEAMIRYEEISSEVPIPRHVFGVYARIGAKKPELNIKWKDKIGGEILSIELKGIEESYIYSEINWRKELTYSESNFKLAPYLGRTRGENVYFLLVYNGGNPDNYVVIPVNIRQQNNYNLSNSFKERNFAFPLLKIDPNDPILNEIPNYDGTGMPYSHKLIGTLYHYFGNQGMKVATAPNIPLIPQSFETRLWQGTLGWSK